MKIAVILSRVPYPLEKGDKLRAFHQLRELSKRHKLYLFALNDSKLHPEAIKILSQFCEEIRIFNLPKLIRYFNAFLFLIKGKPLQCGYFYRKSVKKKIEKQIHRIGVDHIYCQLVRTAEFARDLNYKKTLDYQDVFSKGIDRIIPKSSWWKRGILKMEYKRLVKYEHDIFSCFDHCTIITKVDRSLINHPRSDEIVIVPNGVNMNYYTSTGCKEKKFDLIFTGNMGYMPNVDAAVYIAKKLLPVLTKTYPNIQIALCGTDPSPKVTALKNNNITVTGWVEDMRVYYSQARIFIAPMQLGTGLQNKLLEAMAMRIPCITSPLAADPLKAEVNKDIVVCNSILGYVDAIENLFNDSKYYDQIAENGYKFVKRNYNWENTTKILEEVLMQE